jgi:hypothetical protein
MRVKEIVDGIASAFSGSGTGISEMLSHKRDMESEYRAEAEYWSGAGS